MSDISCPRCNKGANRGGIPTWQIIVAVCFFPIGLLALLAGRDPNSCPHCGHKWVG